MFCAPLLVDADRKDRLAAACIARLQGQHAPEPGATTGTIIRSQKNKKE